MARLNWCKRDRESISAVKESKEEKNCCLAAAAANITRQHWGNGNVASLGRGGLCGNKTVIKHKDRV